MNVFSLASSWVWPMVSPCRRSEKVRVFILWHLPSEAASSWLGQGHCSSYCGLLQVTLHSHILIISPLRPKGVTTLLLLTPSSWTVPWVSTISYHPLTNSHFEKKLFSTYPNLIVPSVSCWDPNWKKFIKIHIA